MANGSVRYIVDDVEAAISRHEAPWLLSIYRASGPGAANLAEDACDS